MDPDEATITRIDDKRTGVYKDEHNQLCGVDTTCAHLGCDVEWNSDVKEFGIVHAMDPDALLTAQLQSHSNKEKKRN